MADTETAVAKQEPDLAEENRQLALAKVRIELEEIEDRRNQIQARKTRRRFDDIAYKIKGAGRILLFVSGAATVGGGGYRAVINPPIGGGDSHPAEVIVAGFSAMTSSMLKRQRKKEGESHGTPHDTD